MKSRACDEVDNTSYFAVQSVTRVRDPQSLLLLLLLLLLLTPLLLLIISVVCAMHHSRVYGARIHGC